MAEPPPENLMDWKKGDLCKEVARLRAILHEHSERKGDDPRIASTSSPIIGGTKHGQGDALLDARSAVLLDGVDVALVDTKQGDEVSMMLVLGGRINYSRDVVKHAYLFGSDGAAGIVSEILMLATRAGAVTGLPHGTIFAQQFRVHLDRRVGS